MGKIKHVLLNLTEEDYEKLANLKGNQKWETFVLSLAQSKTQLETTEKSSDNEQLLKLILEKLDRIEKELKKKEN